MDEIGNGMGNMLDEANKNVRWGTLAISLDQWKYTTLILARCLIHVLANRQVSGCQSSCCTFFVVICSLLFCFSSSSCAFTWRLQAVDWTNECRFCQPRLNTGSWLSLLSEVTEASSDSDSSLWKGRVAFLFFWPTCLFSFSSPSHPKGLGAGRFTNFLTDPPFSGPSFWNGGMWPSLSQHQIECQWIWNWIKEFEVALS